MAIGLVVDDAIVVIEIVEKKLESGLEVKAATLAAMQEIQAPIIAIACVLAAVFIPAAFLDGVTGELYRQFALTIVVSMFFSTIVALTLTPALCVLILRRREKKSSLKIFERLRFNFQSLLEIFMRRKFLAVTILIAVTLCAAWLNEILPSEYISTMNRTIETLNKFSGALKEIDAVENISCIAGIDILGGMSSSGGAIYGILKDWNERDKNLDEILLAVNDTAARVIPEAKIFAMSSGSLPGMESVGAVSMRLLDVKNHSDEELALLAKKIELAANARAELEGVTQNFSVSKSCVDVRVDEDKAKFLGVNLDDVYSTLRVNFGGDEVNDFTSFGRVYKVVVQAQTNYRNSIDAAKFLFVRNSKGEIVPLDTIVTLTPTTDAMQISGYNGVRCVNFDANVGEGFSTAQALDALESVVEEVAPNTFQIEWTEKSRQEKLAQSSVAKIFALSMTFVFLCLVALYESWKIPFAVILSVSTGIFGALLAEVVTGNLASVCMQIGILVIIALTAKNAILIVEFAKVNVEDGQEISRAATFAATERPRPILMTALAFIAACIPLAMASGAGSAARNSMGAAVVGGMFFATVFGIFVVPISFVLIERKNFFGGD